MAKGGVVFTKDNEYYTPKYVVDYFGEFDYDPATCPQKAKEFGIDNFDTIETDGLAQDWTKYKNIWINPPFTRKHEFIQKAQETYDIAKNNIYILFPIEFLTTNRFKQTCKSCKVFIPNGRINFESGLGKKGKSPAFGSVVIKLQDINEVEYIQFDKTLDLEQQLLKLKAKQCGE
jgi:phage N-6-adenine-methyltransferase